MLALTGGDWAILIVAILGSGGMAGMITAYGGLRRLRIDATVAAAASEGQIKTVAAAEAEAAMRIMGESVARLKDEVIAANSRVQAQDNRIKGCEDRCERCETTWLEHLKVCPMWKDPPQ